MEQKGDIKMRIMEIYEHPEDKQLNVPPLFRVHIEFTDVYFDRLKSLPSVRIEYNIK